MADESRSYGKFGGGPDRSTLFDALKRKGDIGDQKEIAEHNNQLQMKRDEKSHEFSTILEQMRHAHIKEREQEAFARTQADNVLTGQAFAGQATNLLNQSASEGFIPRPTLMKPPVDDPFSSEGQMPPQAAPIDPRVGKAVFEDVSTLLREKYASDRRLHERTQADLLNQVTPEDIEHARSMSGIYADYGMKGMAEMFKNIKGWDKDKYRQAVVEADKHMQAIQAKLENAATYTKARLEAERIRAAAREKVELLKNKAKLSSNDLAEAREHRLRIGAELSALANRIRFLQVDLNAATAPVTIKRLEQELIDHQNEYRNLMRIQEELFRVQTKADLAPPSASEKAVNEQNAIVRKALDELGYQNRTERSLKPSERERFLKHMKEKYNMVPE